MYSDENNVDTAGWDTAFAVHYDAANASIVKQWDNINSHAKDVDEYSVPCTIKASLGPWQLCVGGDGHLVWMDIPVQSGTLEGLGDDPIDLTNGVVQVEIDLLYVPDPAVKSKKALQTTNSNTTTCRSFTSQNPNLGPESVANSIVVGMFKTWIQKNVQAFNYVFHYLNVGNDLYNDPTWNFIKPTTVSYAVTDKQTLESSIFGILTMLDNHEKPDGNPHQVSPYAIPSGCNSGFNISGPIYVQDMLMSGAAIQFEQPESVKNAEDFQKAFDAWVDETFIIGDDGMTIWNKAKVKFGTFKDDKGTPRDMYVDARSFRLSITYTQIKLEFNDLKYEYSAGIMVNITYSQYFNVKLVDAEDDDGNPVKVFGLDSGARECKVVVTKSKAVTIIGIVTEIVTSIAGSILGGIAGEAAAGIKGVAEGAVNSVVETSTEATAFFVPDAISNATIELDADMAVMASAEAMGSVTGEMNGMFARLGPKILGSIIGGGVGAAIGAIPEYIELAAKSHFDKLPTFNVFADNCIAAHQWPNQSGYELKEVGLHSSFQIGGNIKYD